jgi:hypothetical protein
MLHRDREQQAQSYRRRLLRLGCIDRCAGQGISDLFEYAAGISASRWRAVIPPQLHPAKGWCGRDLCGELVKRGYDKYYAEHPEEDEDEVTAKEAGTT